MKFSRSVSLVLIACCFSVLPPALAGGPKKVIRLIGFSQRKSNKLSSIQKPKKG